MPLYEYRCMPCDLTAERFLPLSRYHDSQYCESCLEAMTRIIGAPVIIPDYGVYSCPISGKPIEGRTAHRENLKRTGCRLLEPGEREQQVSQARETDEKLEKSLENEAERLVETLPTRQKEQLFNEVQQGATVDVVRR